MKHIILFPGSSVLSAYNRSECSFLGYDGMIKLIGLLSGFHFLSSHECTFVLWYVYIREIVILVWENHSSKKCSGFVGSFCVASSINQTENISNVSRAECHFQFCQVVFPIQTIGKNKLIVMWYCVLLDRWAVYLCLDLN